MGPVIGAVHDDGVISNPQFFELLQDRPDVPVVVDHGIVINALPAAGLAHAFRFGIGPEVHVGEIHPDEERLAGVVLFFDKFRRPGCNVVIDGLHAFLGQRPGVFDPAVSEAVDHTTRPVFLAKLRVLGVVRMLRFLFGIQMIQVTVELIEAVVGR